jgi:hypothetical protein
LLVEPWAVGPGTSNNEASCLEYGVDVHGVGGLWLMLLCVELLCDVNVVDGDHLIWARDRRQRAIPGFMLMAFKRFGVNVLGIWKLPFLATSCPAKASAAGGALETTKADAGEAADSRTVVVPLSWVRK